MAMLDRYRKTGGFAQLIMLLETCGTTKREKFLEIIHNEDPSWAEVIKVKLLDIQRIYSWKDETLSEVIGTLPDLTLATILHTDDLDLRERLFGMLSHGRRRKIEDIFDSNIPSASEILATQIRLIETVRKMIQDGFLRLDKIDPQLMVEDGIEEKLAKKDSMSMSALLETEPGAAVKLHSSTQNTGDNAVDLDLRIQEIGNLKKKLLELAKENAVLRHELTGARNKLDQIRKIA